MSDMIVEQGIDALRLQIDNLLARQQEILALDDDAMRLKQQFFESPSLVDKLAAYWDRRSWWSKMVSYLSAAAMLMACVLVLNLVLVPILAISAFIVLTQLLSSHYQAISARFERVCEHFQQVNAQACLIKDKLLGLSQTLQEINQVAFDDNQVIQEHNQAMHIEISDMTDALQNLNQSAASVKESVIHIEAAELEWTKKTTDSCTLMADLNRVATTEVLQLVDITADLTQTNTQVKQSVVTLEQVLVSMQSRLEQVSVVAVAPQPMSVPTETLLARSNQQHAQTSACVQQAEAAIASHASLLARINAHMALCAKATPFEHQGAKMIMV